MSNIQSLEPRESAEITMTATLNHALGFGVLRIFKARTSIVTLRNDVVRTEALHSYAASHMDELAECVRLYGADTTADLLNGQPLPDPPEVEP